MRMIDVYVLWEASLRYPTIRNDKLRGERARHNTKLGYSNNVA